MEIKNENIILYDWFSISSKYGTKQTLIDLLQFNTEIKWQESYGMYGYRNRIFFDGISIHYNHWNKEQDYPLLEMSGQGCRDFETYTDGNWDRLFECAVNSDEYNITRLDVAYDDYIGILDIKKILTETEKRNYCARSQKGVITNSFSANNNAMSVMFGSKSSEFYCRIYDKARERGIVGDKHWIRCEIVMKHERAFNFLIDSHKIGERYGGVLNNYIRFCIPSGTDTNKARWKTAAWWNKFIATAEKIHLTTHKTVEYNLSRLGRYVFHQSGNSIETYIKCVGLVKFLEDLKIRESKLNPHQRRIIDEYKALCNTSNTDTDYDKLGSVENWVTKNIKKYEDELWNN